MRNLNVLAFCHGDYVTCKLNEIMNEDMKRLGYTSGETDAVARQAAVISVVPQDNLKNHLLPKSALSRSTTITMPRMTRQT